MISVSVKISTKGPSASARLKKIETALTTGPKAIKVGFPAGKAPGDLISIAYWNHEGTNRAKGEPFKNKKGKFGISGPIPPRPFITMAMFNGRHEIRRRLLAETAALVEGKASDFVAGLTSVGAFAQDLVQVQITSNMGPANSPMTIQLKGSSHTLVDFGRMAASVTWDFDK